MALSIYSKIVKRQAYAHLYLIYVFNDKKFSAVQTDSNIWKFIL